MGARDSLRYNKTTLCVAMRTWSRGTWQALREGLPEEKTQLRPTAWVGIHRANTEGQVTRLRRQLCRVWQIWDWEARVEWEEARDAGDKAGKACLGRIMKGLGLHRGINCTFVQLKLKALRASRSVCAGEGHKDMGPIGQFLCHSTQGEVWSRLEAVGGRRLGCIQEMCGGKIKMMWSWIEQQSEGRGGDATFSFAHVATW